MNSENEKQLRKKNEKKHNHCMVIGEKIKILTIT